MGVGVTVNRDDMTDIVFTRLDNRQYAIYHDKSACLAAEFELVQGRWKITTRATFRLDAVLLMAENIHEEWNAYIAEEMLR